MNVKHATPDHAIHELLAARWSPYVFGDRDVAQSDLVSLFEAVRWAPSSYNEQPWRYLVARRSDRAAFEQALSCLVEGNQAWAKHVPVLALAITSMVFQRNGKPNAAAIHDLGLAAGNLCLEATSRGLHVHQMIGIVAERVREVYGVPEDYRPLTALAIGYAAKPGEGEEKFAERDGAARTRKPLRDFVFSGAWGKGVDWS